MSDRNRCCTRFSDDLDYSTDEGSSSFFASGFQRRMDSLDNYLRKSEPRPSINTTMNYKTVYDDVDVNKAQICRTLIQKYKMAGKWLGADRVDNLSYNVYSYNEEGQVIEIMIDKSSGNPIKHRIVGEEHIGYRGWDGPSFNTK